MTRLTLPKRVAVVAALTAAVTLGMATSGRAQTPPDFINITNCVAPLAPTVWMGFCTPVWKLPIGAPEISFDNGGTVTYDGSQLLTIKANVTAVYFDQTGHNDFLYQPTPDRMLASSVTIRANVGNDGKLVGGAGGACGLGTFDDFCITGVTTNPGTGATYGTTQPLVRGRIERMTQAPNAINHDGLQDDFEFYINITGGDIFNAFWLPNGFNHLAVEVFGYNPPELQADGTPNPAHVAWNTNNPFGAAFTERFVFGYTGVTVNDNGFLFDPCNGKISGLVSDYFNPTLGIAGSEVQVTGQPNAIPDANGAYSTAGKLCVGNYTVTVLPPAAYTVYGASSQVVSVVTGANGANTIVSGINFKLYSSPLNTSSYTTFLQAGWGTKPRGQNAGQLIATYYSFLYPTGEIVVGIPDTPGRYSITETGAPAIQDFLPQEGRPLPLTASYVDPASRFKIQHKGKYAFHRRIGSLAGETMALELNVRMSAYSLTKHGLGSLHVASGKMAGQTVDQVLALANRVLGGDPLPTTFRNYDELEDIVERINWNFLAGAWDLKFLIP